MPAPGSSAAQLSGGQQAIVTKVKPGLAIINTTPRYDSEAAGTGMVINADRLVLTNNHVIDDSTKITGTVASTGKAYPATVMGYDKTESVALSSCKTHRADDGTDRQLLLGQGRIRRRGPGHRPGPGHHHHHGGQVTALRETTCEETPCLASDCMESSQVSSAGPNAGNVPLTSPVAIIGLVGMLAPSFTHPREPRQWQEVF